MIMPNHLHGIVIITDVGATRPLLIQASSVQEANSIHARNEPEGSPLRNARPKGPAKGSLGAIIAQFKSRATKQIWKHFKTDRAPVWQRNYYEHIIRNQGELRKITDYIQMNPVNWEVDEEYPK